jgi:peroxiredoxin
MRADIVPGAVFPDYELSDHRGKHRKLSELQGGDPLVLVLLPSRDDLHRQPARDR